MEVKGKYRTSSKTIEDGYYYINKVLFINLTKYKELDTKYVFKSNGKYNAALFFNISIDHIKNKSKTKSLVLDFDNTIYIESIKKLTPENTKSINSFVNDVEQWVTDVNTNKNHQIFNGITYVKYIADLLRTDKVLIAKTITYKYD